MNIFGIGTDIVNIKRIQNSLKKNKNFKKKIFTKFVTKICEKRANKINILSDSYIEKYKSNHGSFDYRSSEGIMRDILVSAVNDAIINAKNNNIKNSTFICGDLANLFEINPETKSIENPDVMVIDPPRAGIHPKTIPIII